MSYNNNHLIFELLTKENENLKQQIELFKLMIQKIHNESQTQLHFLHEENSILKKRIESLSSKDSKR